MDALPAGTTSGHSCSRSTANHAGCFGRRQDDAEGSRASSKLLRNRQPDKVDGHTTTSIARYGSPLASSFYLLNKRSKAARASLILAGPVVVSFSSLMRREKKRQSFLAVLFSTRELTGCEHSKRPPGSNELHWRQECNSAPHLLHWPIGSACSCKIAPHMAHRETLREPGI